MDDKKTYLDHMAKWVKEVKQVLSTTTLDETEREIYNEQLKDLEEELNQLLNKDGIDGNEIRIIKEKGKKIIQHWGKNQTNSVDYGKHRLPKLPYAYDALEPYISEEIMRLHHTEHHQSYVEGLNKAETKIYVEKDTNVVKHWLREQAFHGSGHYLHTIFWENMTPHSTKVPKKEIKAQIDRDFGSFQVFKNLFTDVASSVEGVGWAALLWSLESKKLAVQSFEKHQLFHIANTIPLLVLDMWEHAYYLQYKTDKKAYIDNWWNVVNWENVNERLLMSQRLS